LEPTWSAPKDKDANTRVKISTIAANGRMQLLLFEGCNYSRKTGVGWFPVGLHRYPQALSNSSLEDAKLNSSCLPPILSLFAPPRLRPRNGRQSGSCARLGARSEARRV